MWRRIRLSFRTDKQKRKNKCHSELGDEAGLLSSPPFPPLSSPLLSSAFLSSPLLSSPLLSSPLPSSPLPPLLLPGQISAEELGLVDEDQGEVRRAYHQQCAHLQKGGDLLKHCARYHRQDDAEGDKLKTHTRDSQSDGRRGEHSKWFSKWSCFCSTYCCIKRPNNQQAHAPHLLRCVPWFAR